MMLYSLREEMWTVKRGQMVNVEIVVDANEVRSRETCIYTALRQTEDPFASHANSTYRRCRTTSVPNRI